MRIIGAFFILALALTSCSQLPADDEGAVPVPDVVGMSGDQARSELDAAGLTSTIDVTSESAVIPNDWTVEAQEPAPGTRVGANTEIVLRAAGSELGDDEVALGTAHIKKLLDVYGECLSAIGASVPDVVFISDDDGSVDGYLTVKGTDGTLLFFVGSRDESGGLLAEPADVTKAVLASLDC
jgi:hypothetical protein